MKIDESGQPMMSDADIAMISKLLNERDIFTVLEWGSGNSTIRFSAELAKYTGRECTWTSIEDNGHYIDYLAPKVDARIVNLVWVQDGADYVDCVKKNVGHYDMILIDGKEGSRERCLEEAMKIIKPDGIVLLHDAYRKEYKEFIEKYANREALTPGEVPDGPHHFVHRGLMAFYP